MQRQDFCSLPWCGKTGKIDLHHVKPRSQGGSDDDDNIVAICHECHMRHHGEQHIKFEIRQGEYYAYHNYRWQKLIVHNEFNQLQAQSASDPLGALGESIRELKCSADQVDYYLSLELAEALITLHGDREELCTWIADNLNISHRSVDSYLSKRLAYSTLEPLCGVKELGITNGYRLYRLTQQGHGLQTLLDDFHTMPKAQFDAQYSDKKQPDTHACPECGRVHTRKEGR